MKLKWLIALLLLNDRFPRLANPGPVLTDILGRFFPALLVPTRPANRSSSSWAFTYAFDQYFWQPEGDPKRGVGLFFAFGTSDSNPNPTRQMLVTIAIPALKMSVRAASAGLTRKSPWRQASLLARGSLC